MASAAIRAVGWDIHHLLGSLVLVDGLRIAEQNHYDVPCLGMRKTCGGEEGTQQPGGAIQIGLEGCSRCRGAADGSRRSEKIVITLADCLVSRSQARSSLHASTWPWQYRSCFTFADCSGCVTSAETMLVNERARKSSLASWRKALAWPSSPYRRSQNGLADHFQIPSRGLSTPHRPHFFHLYSFCTP